MTLNDIILRSSEAIIEAAHEKHLTDYKVLMIAAKAVRQAIEELEYDTGEELLPAFLDGAVSTLIGLCWQARERRQQMDIFEDLEVMGATFDRAQYMGDLAR